MFTTVLWGDCCFNKYYCLLKKLLKQLLSAVKIG